MPRHKSDPQADAVAPEAWSENPPHGEEGHEHTEGDENLEKAESEPRQDEPVDARPTTGHPGNPVNEALGEPVAAEEPADVWSDDRKPDYFVVAHAAVGGWSKGQRIPADKLSDEDAKRLVELGAVYPGYQEK